MTKPQIASEPSMEDILASIRKMISEDRLGPRPVPDQIARTTLGERAPAASLEPAGQPHNLTGNGSEGPARASSAEPAAVAPQYKASERPVPSFSSLSDALKSAGTASARASLDDKLAHMLDGKGTTAEPSPFDRPATARSEPGPASGIGRREPEAPGFARFDEPSAPLAVFSATRSASSSLAAAEAPATLKPVFEKADQPVAPQSSAAQSSSNGSSTTEPAAAPRFAEPVVQPPAPDAVATPASNPAYPATNAFGASAAGAAIRAIRAEINAPAADEASLNGDATPVGTPAAKEQPSFASSAGFSPAAAESKPFAPSFAADPAPVTPSPDAEADAAHAADASHDKDRETIIALPPRFGSPAAPGFGVAQPPHSHNGGLNGTGLNGSSLNGSGLNGAGLNGVGSNGSSLNGGHNGSALNGGLNGTHASVIGLRPHLMPAPGTAQADATEELKAKVPDIPLDPAQLFKLEPRAPETDADEPAEVEAESGWEPESAVELHQDDEPSLKPVLASPPPSPPMPSSPVFPPLFEVTPSAPSAAEETETVAEQATAEPASTAAADAAALMADSGGPSESLLDAVVELVNAQPEALSVFTSGANFINGAKKTEVAKPGDPAVPAKLDGAAAELLRPMLRQWLADNMPRIVEEALRSELMSAQGKDPGKP